MNKALPVIRRHSLISLLLFLPAIVQGSHACEPPALPVSTVSISILSVLQPAEITISLRQPDRAILEGDDSQSVIQSGVPLKIQLQTNLLQTESGVSREFSIQCVGFCLFELSLPGLNRRQYKGNLRLTTGLSTINIVLITERNDLLSSIVASEMGEYRTRPSLEAFAVVARSFLHAGRRHPELGADFCDLTHCQVFQSYAPSDEAHNAVQATSGLVLTYKRKPFRPYYFRNCGGTTATFDEVWGKPSPDYPFTQTKCTCNTSWSTILEPEELNKILGSAVTSFSQTGTGLDFILGNARRSYRAEEFRIASGRVLGWNRIQSNYFVANQDGGAVHFHGKGIGHRVGFCQNGAFQMSLRGKSFQEILQYYFPNTEIRNL